MKLGALSKKRWSPLATGAGLGLCAAISLSLVGRPLGASGAYLRLAAYAGRALAPANVYFGVVAPPEIGWQAILLVGVFSGAFVSALLGGELRLRWVPESGWREAFGASRATRWVLAFAGAFLIEVGAGIAGGCTSGLAVSGGVVLSPGAFVFMAGMFAAGIPTAALVARRRR